MKQYTDSPVPEHIPFNPESAFTEMLCKDKEKQPVFSSRALENGKDAYGYQFLREGFAWNSQMDIAWALGFPYFLIVADGVPELEYPQLKETDYNQYSEDIISRKNLWANCHFALTQKNPYELPESEFMKYAVPREISDKELMLLIDREKKFTISLDQVEELVGPDRLAEAIIRQAETAKKKQIYELNLNLHNSIGLFRRIKTANVENLKERLKASISRIDYAETPAMYLLDPMNLSENEPSHMSTPCAANTQWLDNHPEFTMMAAEAGRIIAPGIPYRNIFTGTERIFDLFNEYHKDMDRLVRNNAQRDVFTTIKTDKLLSAQLSVWRENRYTNQMQLWFENHKDFLLPALNELGKKKGKFRDAANDLLVAIGEAPQAKLTPSDKQKNLNPKDEWELTFDQLDKLVDEIIAADGDAKKEKKSFKKILGKCKAIAVEFGYDWDVEIFGRAYAEQDFDKLSEVQFKRVQELYSELL
jgi:hypothetical protein